jgi:hypothetical protein
VSEPFTLRVFVPSGNAEGARIVDRMNWTGRGYFISRDNWPEMRQRKELSDGGIYVLLGYETDELGAEVPLAYIGQTDSLRKRIDDHDAKLDFWSRAVFFISTGGGLNRAHTTWLEWALLQRAGEAKRCRLCNVAMPTEPKLIESEKADTRAFLTEMLRMMPTMGVQIFEKSSTIVPLAKAPTPGGKDVIVVPAQKEGFEAAYMRAHAWWAVRIAQKYRETLKWIAAYQVAPVKAVTHVAPIAAIEPFGDEGKYKIVFAGPPVELQNPVPFGDAPSGAMQGSRYTSFDKLQSARSIKELI